MKKSFYFFTVLVTAVLFWACTNEDGISDAGLQVNAGVRSIDEAVQIAKNSYQDFYGRSSRNTSAPVCSKENCFVVRGRSSRGMANDTILYVINFDNDEGFALINPMENKTPLLGISEEGHYNPEEGTENENFEFFMENLTNYITMPGNPLDPPIIPIFRPHTVDSINPKVKVLWGQHSPYGDECSNGIAGCANTAMAMIISYFEFPQVLQLTYPNHPQYSVIFNWDELLLHAKAPSRGCQENRVAETHAALAQMCRQLGYLAGSSYYPTKTRTSTYAPPSVLSNLGYNVSPLYYFNEENCRTALHGFNLVYMMGSAVEGGHAWLMDGYKYVDTATLRLDGSHVMKTYFHYNWGWNGDCNGYFLSDVFDTTAATEYDNPEWTENNYNFIEDIIYFTASSL